MLSSRPLAELASAIGSGSYKPEVVCHYGGTAGGVSVLDNHVDLDTGLAKYHSTHEWILRDGRLSVLLVYLHEYDLFEKAWR